MNVTWSACVSGDSHVCIFTWFINVFQINRDVRVYTATIILRKDR